MPRARPPINPDVLKWAVDESGYLPEDLADSLEVAVPTFEAWTRGEESPTQGQFTKLARKLKRPKSIFFLPAPPEASGLPSALRRAVGRTERELAADELLWVRRANRLQRFVSLIERDRGAEPVAMPGFSIAVDSTRSGTGLRAWLGVTVQDQLEWRSERDALEEWRGAFERRGVLVMQMQLGDKGLRGFALADDYAPVVVANTRENPQARIFTLLHELAHLASRTETSCLQGVGTSTDADRVERWCESAAGSALLPREGLEVEMRSVRGPERPDFALVEHIATRFKASLRATAIALIDAGLAPGELYAEVDQAAPSSDFAKKAGFGGGGQEAWRTRLREVGPRAANTVLAAMETSRVNELEARRYLNLDSTGLTELAAQFRSPA